MTPDTYRQLRVSLNLTQGELANALGVSRSTIARRETGEVPMEWCARQAWEGCAIEGYDFQDEMVKRGLMVEVPATEDFRDEWDADTMYVMAWSPLADPDRHPHTEDESE